MHLRFVRLKLDRRRVADFRKFYGDRVIHALQTADGCLFASLFEGPTSFDVGDVAYGRSDIRVAVRFRYGTDTHWQDEIVVRRERGVYVIDDVVFAGAGPFNPPGRLSEALGHPAQSVPPARGDYE